MHIINNNKNRQGLPEEEALHGIVKRARVCRWNDVKEGVIQKKPPDQNDQAASL